MGEPGWILWAGTLGLEGDVTTRAEAAVAAGYQRVSMSPLDLANAEAAGTSAAEIGAAVRALGLDIVIDPIMNWYGGSPAPSSRFGRFTADQTLRWCEQVGAVSATAIGQATRDVASEVIVESFASLCDRAAGIGLDVHLEFTAIHAIDSLASAWDVVREADRANGGLCFDTWHFFRTGADFALLESIPGERIYCVQVDDALAEVTGSLRDDTLNRLMPGEGTFELARVLGVLDRIGGLLWIGPEVISPATAALDPVVAAEIGRTSIQDILAEVRSA